MSRLKTACSTEENLIRATERALGSVNPSKKSTPFYLFTVSSLYREPWLSRDLLLKEAGEETMLFGLLSSGPLFSQDGFYEKGLILGRIDSPELHLESVILEGNGQKLEEKIQDAFFFLTQRRNGSQMLLLAFADKGFGSHDSVVESLALCCRNHSIEGVGGFIDSSSLGAHSGIFYNSPTVGKALLLIGLYHRGGVSLGVTQDEPFKTEASPEGSHILASPSSLPPSCQCSLFPVHPYFSVATAGQFHLPKEGTPRQGLDLVVRVDF